MVGRAGGEVLVTEQAVEADLIESKKKLADSKVTYHLGGHKISDLKACDLLVISPAVDKHKSPFVQEAIRLGVPISSEMNLFLERCRGRIVGITGSVGKSTTTAMVGAILESASSRPEWNHGKVWIGGNIGKSLLDDLGSISSQDIVVLELSSFQLEDAAQLRKSPSIALVTNVRENHLDRHGTLAAYAAAKANIHRFQSPDDWLILPFVGAEALPDVPTENRNMMRFSADEASHGAAIESRDANGVARREVVPLKLSIPGLHNVQNAAGALAIARVLGVDDGIATDALSRFTGLVHRLEFVREHRGVRYYNDSKATSPEAAMTSIRAFDQPVTVLVGGSDKGGSFEQFGVSLQTGQGRYLHGATRDRITAAIRIASTGCGIGPTLLPADNFATAVSNARELAKNGEVVLLSPGCASYDWFKNYEERGDQFRGIVNGWSA
ncbi:MAG: UDP-N-acetylmuramoyl-L-alanine--D-glutamate ligase [Planctomycetes bacterium]|nr:UDP-N-acetylmuramoyl-L-alanine--D-glutamate ligase [Planctomycetota bacterium]